MLGANKSTGLAFDRSPCVRSQTIAFADESQLNVRFNLIPIARLCIYKCANQIGWSDDIKIRATFKCHCRRKQIVQLQCWKLVSMAPKDFIAKTSCPWKC